MKHQSQLADRIAEGLYKIGLASKQQTWHSSTAEGVSATQGQILALLVAHGSMSVTELAQKMGVSLPTVSDSVRVLVEKGFSVKAPDERHPRAVLVTLTPAGRKIGTRARAWPEMMAEAVSSLSSNEQAAFYSGVVKMIHALQEQGLVPLGGMCVNCVHFRPNSRSGKSPHYCELIEAPLGPGDLRLDCNDHQLVEASERERLFQEFQNTRQQSR